VSRLRARCPACGTLTAVAVGTEYECHSCGRVWEGGLVRVPRAWGEGGEAMADAAHLPLAWPEAAVVAEDTLAGQTLEIASDLPARPLVLGGCCCSHVGAVEGLAARHDRLALIWLDAHGDLNTPASSPSGNEWGMPLRMLLDAGTVEPRHVALVGARALDPPERDFLASSQVHTGADAIERATADVGCVYVAFDADVLEPGTVAAFMPEPGGPSFDEAEALLRDVAERHAVVGAGFSGLRGDPSNTEAVTRLAAALGFASASTSTGNT
jgi:arginase family enzyme